MATSSFVYEFERRLRGISAVAVRWRIVDLFTALSDACGPGPDQINVVVLTARRMACLYALAQAAGLRLDASVQVTSDRYTELLDLPGGWDGKNLVILDDVVDTGRTLAERFDRADLASGAAIVTANAVCMSEDRSFDLPPLREELGEPIVLTEAELIRFSGDLAKTLTENLIPLITDFPVSSVAEVPVEWIDNVLAMPGWSSYDVTNSLLAGSEVRCYSLIPSTVEPPLPAPVAGLADICKVRIYAQLGVETAIIRVVPMVTLHPMDARSVRAYFDTLGYRRLAEDERGAAVGLMIYVMSSLLLGSFTDVAEANGIIDVPAIDREIMSLYLGESVMSRLQQEFGADMLDGLSTIGIHPVQYDDQDDQVFSGLGVVEDHCIVGDDLVGPVADAIAVDGATVAGSIGAELRLPASVYSLGLDVLNDLGWAVPMSTVVDDLQVRAFARGEISRNKMRPGLLGGRFASVPMTLLRSHDDPEATQVRSYRDAATK